MRGRPLGFLALVTFAWIGIRTAMLWPEPMRRIAATVAHGPSGPSGPPRRAMAAIRGDPRSTTGTAVTPPRRSGPAATQMLTDARILALYGLRYFVERPEPRPHSFSLAARPPTARGAPADAAGAAVASGVPASSRWSVAAWLSLREGGGDPRLVPLLGAAQAGVRMTYAVSDDRRAAVFGRIAAPLARGPAEAAAGVQWRPGSPPVTAFVEARVRAGAVIPAAGAFGGGSVDLPADFRIDGYGQAGWIGGRNASGFAEGQARMTRTMARVDGTAIELGAGAWGAAQRGAARLDVGPGTGVVLPIGRGTVRLALDWRQRIAGRATPGSGPVLTLGAGF